jgi:hypothetical protein
VPAFAIGCADALPVTRCLFRIAGSFAPRLVQVGCSPVSPFALLARSARYIAPIAVLSAIVWAPIALVALGVMVPANAAQARVVLRVAWLVAGSGMLAVLVLVGALAPIVRSERVSQLVALGRGLRGLVRAIVPAAIVTCALAMGLVALVVPGIVLYVMLVLATASEADGVGAKLADSAVRVRERLPAVVIVVAFTIVALVAVVVVQQWMLPIPLGKTPPRIHLVMFSQMVRVTAIAMAGIVPMSAFALAAIAASDRVTSGSR